MHVNYKFFIQTFNKVYDLKITFYKVKRCKLCARSLSITTNLQKRSSGNHRPPQLD